MDTMRKNRWIVGLALLGLTACLKPYEDTSFVPQPAVITWSEPSKSVGKDATEFQITLHSNLPWRAVSSVSWLRVTPSRGLGDEVLTVKVSKNRTPEVRSGILRVIVTEDQYSEYTVTQAASEGGGSSNTYFARPDGDPAASGLSWANATSLSNAIDLSGDGDVILLAAGVYTPEAFLEGSEETDSRDKTFQIHSNFTLQGGYPANPDDEAFDPVADYDPSVNVTTLSGTMADGKQAYHVVTVFAPKAAGHKAALKGLTITGGLTGDAEQKESFVSAGGSQFSRAYGAGINVGASVLELTDCIITGNMANLHAAGAYFNAQSEVYMTDCRVVSNESMNNAGGVWNCGGSVYMNRCSISNNISGEMAGGFYSINSDGIFSLSRIYNTTISGNSTTKVRDDRSGGGAYIRANSDAVFVNCTFYNNLSGNGGAIEGHGANSESKYLVRLINCTVTGNTARLLGGGVCLWNNYGALNIHNCIISGNTCDTGADVGIGTAVGANAPNLSYEATIVGKDLYSSYGVKVAGWSFETATMLSEFGMWGGRTQTCTLVDGPANPAASEGMTKDALVALGASLEPAVEASVFDTDQRGEERTRNTIGATTL